MCKTLTFQWHISQKKPVSSFVDVHIYGFHHMNRDSCQTKFAKRHTDWNRIMGPAHLQPQGQFNWIQFNFNFQFSIHTDWTRFWAQLICSRKDRTALTATFLALCHFLSSVQLMHYYAYIHFIFTLLLALRILTSWQLLRFGILPFLFLIFSS